MTDIDTKELRRLAEAFAQDHVAELAEEIIEWQDTALLREGRLRELRVLCAKYTGSHDGLKVAEAVATRASMESVLSLRERLEEAKKESQALRALIGASHAHVYGKKKTDAEQAAENAALKFGKNETVEEITAHLVAAVERVSSPRISGSQEQEGKNG